MNKLTELRHLAISVVVILYFFFITIYCLPNSGRWRDWALTPVRSFVEWSGLWQDWSMFSPNPEKFNCYITAVIWYNDHTSEIYGIPRLEKMTLLERAFKERWRKFQQDNLNNDSRKWMWPYFARYVARTHNSANRHPISVELVRHYAFTPEPKKAFAGDNKLDWQEFYFFRYNVNPRDLQ